MKKIYLDYASTTPVDKEVQEAMEPYWIDKFGNPNSLHSLGQEAMRAIDDSREIIKNFLNADALREIIFTGSATEANNLAIQGFINYGPPRSVGTSEVPHIIISNIEHHSVLEVCIQLEKQGKAEITFIKAGKNGIVEVKEIKNALKENTILVSIMYANNEIGIIQPIAKISEVVRNFREELRIKNQESGKKEKPIIRNSLFMLPVFHTDAVQAAQFLEMDVKKLGVDMLTISAHKIYGPKGVGVLYVKDGIKLGPILYGGRQEYGLRPGTQSVPLIVGMAKAVKLISRENPRGKIKELRDYTINKILNEVPGTQLNGAKEPRLANNINILFNNIESDKLRIGLAEKGICVSSGAACSSRAQEASHVIQALGRSKKQTEQSVRISLGRQTTKEQINYFLDILFDLTSK